VSAVDLSVLLAFWFLGGFRALDAWVRSWNAHPVPTGLAFIGILVAARFLLSMPFEAYRTFVIEERFGFNKTTPSVFVKDTVKTVLLSAALGAPLLGGMLAFFQAAGPKGWIACWAAAAGFMAFIQFVAPVWILPFFNTFTPLRNGRLKSGLLAYAHSVHYPVTDIVVMDGSKRSTKSNAFFTGFGKTRRIALYDTVIEKHSAPDLVSVLAHEIGHYKKGHVWIGLAIGIANAGVMLFLLSLFLAQEGLFRAFGVEDPSVYAGMLFFGLLFSPVEVLLSMGMHAVSRSHEIQADAFAVRTAQNPGAFVRALKKLSLHNLVNLTPHPFHVFMHYSHPPVLERIHRIRMLGSRIRRFNRPKEKT